nr:DUF5658 family protein [Fimbriimonas ginsengisoli]
MRNAVALERRDVRPLVLPETLLLATICFADMIQTLVVVGSGKAVEANPVLARAMAYSPWAFVALKMVSFIAPLAAVELLRHRSPNFIRLALRIGAIGYLVVYIVGSLHINHVLQLPW